MSQPLLYYDTFFRAVELCFVVCFHVGELPTTLRFHGAVDGGKDCRMFETSYDTFNSRAAEVYAVDMYSLHPARWLWFLSR